MTLYIPESMGWGNVVLCVSDLVHNTKEPRAYKKIIDVDRGFTFKGVTITDDENEPRFEPKIYLNDYYFNVVHTNVKDFLEPTPELLELAKEHKHDAKYGLHIRRGAYSKDSERIGCHGIEEDGTIKKAFFTSEESLQHFFTIVEKSNEKFFLASDSKETKQIFRDKFPGRIITFDNDIALTYDCIFLKNEESKRSRLDSYLDWFLLSQCKHVYITSNSTFGYSAAVYGGAAVELVF